MPTYDYRCTSCKHAFEEFQSMTAKVLRKCPSCGKPALERLIGTGAAVMFKGSGFYQTDYRSEGYKSAASADKPAEPASGTPKADASAGATPATKPEAKAPSPKADSTSEAKPRTKPETKPEPKNASKPATKSSSNRPNKA